MSYFASLSNGDIWALSGISFARFASSITCSMKVLLIESFYSPINDLLDSGIYTLDDILEQDELIQEVKSKNVRLID